MACGGSGVVGMRTPGDPVEDYLDRLYARLRQTPREGRRILAEAEDHLREAVARGRAAGLTEQEAQQAAISAFGSVAAVARAHDARRWRQPAAAVLGELVMAAWKLASAGLVAIGASGLVAAAMNLALGPAFVGGAPRAAGFAGAACRHFLAVQPAARTCAQAAMLENSSDAVWLRLLAGIAGLFVLAGYLAARRGYLLARRGAPGVLPGTFVPTVAITLFGAAAAGLAWLAAGHAVVGVSSGTGFYLSGVIVALAAAAAYVAPLRKALLRRAAALSRRPGCARSGCQGCRRWRPGCLNRGCPGRRCLSRRRGGERC